CSEPDAEQRIGRTIRNRPIARELAARRGHVDPGHSLHCRLVYVPINTSWFRCPGATGIRPGAWATVQAPKRLSRPLWISSHSSALLSFSQAVLTSRAGTPSRSTFDPPFSVRRLQTHFFHEHLKIFPHVSFRLGFPEQIRRVVC